MAKRNDIQVILINFYNLFSCYIVKYKMGFMKSLTHKINHSVKHFGKQIHHKATQALNAAGKLDRGLGKAINYIEHGYSAGKRGLIKEAGRLGLGQELRAGIRTLEASPLAGVATGALGTVKNARALGQDYLALARTQNNKVQQLVNS